MTDQLKELIENVDDVTVAGHVIVPVESWRKIVAIIEGVIIHFGKVE